MIIQQRDINIVKGLLQLAISNLEYSRYYWPADADKNAAFQRGLDLLKEAVETLVTIGHEGE